MAKAEQYYHDPNNGATVHKTRLFPSGMYLVELRGPEGDLLGKLRLDDKDDAEATFRRFRAKAKTL